MFRTRFIGYLSFALNYQIHGLDVTGYHIVNFLVHAVNAGLFYALVLLSFRTPILRSSSIAPFSGGIALFSSLLFILHPIQTQAVTYTVQRFTSLATLFYLLSTVLYVKWRVGGQNMAGHNRSARWAFYALSVLSAVLAMKTKEIAFTLPFAITLYEFMFFEGPVKKRVYYLMPILLTLPIIPYSMLNTANPGDIIGDVSETTRLQTSMGRGEYLFTEFRVIVTYLRLLFLPIGQTLDYDYPVYHSFFEPMVILSFLLILSVIGIAVYLLMRSRAACERRLVAFGIFWFFIALSVESGIIPIADVIYEHRVYLPSVGAFVALATFLFMVAQRVMRRSAIKKVLTVVPILVFIALGGATYARNAVWQDNVKFWEDSVQKAPMKARVHYGLGLAYMTGGQFDKAIESFKVTLRLRPNSSDAYVSLALAYESKGLIDEAIAQFQNALSVNPSDPNVYSNLGVIYLSRGQMDKAIEHCLTAVKLNPNFAEAYYNLSLAYSAKGDKDKADEYYGRALRLKPEIAGARY